MNLKVANLVGIQFGIFVGMMAWLVYSHFEASKPQRSAEERTRIPVNSATTSAPQFEPGDQGPLDSRADRAQSLTEPPVPVVQYEYSPEAVQRYSALAAQMYYRQIAPRPPAISVVENREVTAEEPTYTQVEQAPAAVPAEYEEQPQIVAYEQPAQFVAYAEPYPFIPYSHARAVRRRCSPPRHHAPTPVRHQRHDIGMPRLSGYADFRPDKSLESCSARTMTLDHLPGRPRDSGPGVVVRRVTVGRGR